MEALRIYYYSAKATNYEYRVYESLCCSTKPLRTLRKDDVLSRSVKRYKATIGTSSPYRGTIQRLVSNREYEDEAGSAV